MFQADVTQATYKLLSIRTNHLFQIAEKCLADRQQLIDIPEERFGFILVQQGLFFLLGEISQRVSVILYTTIYQSETEEKRKCYAPV